MELSGTADLSGPAHEIDGGRLSQQTLTVTVPLEATETGQWSLGVDAARTRLGGSPALSPSGAPWPEILWNTGISLSHRRPLEGDRIVGGSVRLGAAGDHNLTGGSTLQATAFLLLPAREEDRWMVAVNYSSDREFLRHVPIPGGGYLLRRGRMTALLGVPFFLETAVAGPVRMRLSYVPSRTYALTFSAPTGSRTTLFAALESDVDRYRRADRSRSRDRLFLHQRQVRAGIDLRLAHGVSAELSAGRSLARTLVEGREFSHLSRSSRRLSNEHCVTLRLRASLGSPQPATGAVVAR